MQLKLSRGDIRLVKQLLIFVIIAFIIFLFFRKFTQVFVSVILIIIGSLSTLYKRFVNVSTGFELITFSTIALTYLNGIGFGIAAAIIMVVIAAILTNRVCVPMFVQLGAYILICLLSKLLMGSSLFIGAMILVVIFNLLIHFCYLFLFRFSPVNSLISLPANIFLNFLLFRGFSGFFMGLK